MILAGEIGFNFISVMLHWLKWLGSVPITRLKHKKLARTVWLRFFEGIGYKIGNNSVSPTLLRIVSFVWKNPQSNTHR